jgi:signal transduction histidine kinase
MTDGGRAARTFSLRTHLLLLVLGTLLPGLLLAAFLARTVVADNRAQVEARLLEMARLGAAQVDAELVGTTRALQGLAESHRLADGDLAGFYTQAMGLLRTQPTWMAVSVAAPNGRQLANTERPFGVELPFGTDRESVARVVKTKAPAIGTLRIGGVSGQWGFAVRVPVVRDGEVRYVVSAWITSTQFIALLQRQSSTLPSGWIRGVSDSTNALVARTVDAERFLGSRANATFARQAAETDEGVYIGETLEGRQVYAAFSRAPVSRWIAGVAAPRDPIEASFRQSWLALLALTLILLAAGGAGTYVVSRRIATDMSRSTAEAEAIAGGRGPSEAPARVTEVQRLLEALKQSAALLATRERERDEQVARADAARDEAQAADRAKDQFLAMLGHELRNPLAPALTAIELMKRKGETASTRERDVIERQIRHMARLVDDLLDMSRLRRGIVGLERERVDVADVIARAVEMTAPLFAERRHALDIFVAPGLLVDADRVRLAQVVSNLLANAAKYTEPGGRVTLTARGEASEIVIDCRDTGIGIAPELVPRVFDLFVQGERGIDRREGGLGLGLAVARSLIELHGGRIEAASEGAQRGSTFTVRLPAPSPGSAPKPPPVLPRQDAPPPAAVVGRVLVVDDNADALAMIVTALRDAGIEVFGASLPSEALALAARVQPLAAVLDIGLPEMTGFELAYALRRQAEGAQLRLIAVTGYGQEQDMAAARAAGFDAFFVKPVEVGTLIEALAREVMAP